MTAPSGKPLRARDQVVEALRHAAESSGLLCRVDNATVSFDGPLGAQLWVCDVSAATLATLQGRQDFTCAVAVRDEPWLLNVPSVRVAEADGRWLVLDGCRRFSVVGCEAGWHGDQACAGHAVVGHPDPFPFERLVSSIANGRIEAAFVDGLVDPVGASAARWGGWVWMRAEEADVLREWQGVVEAPAFDPVVFDKLNAQLV